ncbi:MAG: HD-GYP domain-containing protein [bacterium]
MKDQDIHREKPIEHGKEDPVEPLSLVYPILRSDIDCFQDLEHFLQKVVEASATIVAAKSSKLILFDEKEASILPSTAAPDAITSTDHTIHIPLILKGLEHPMGYIEVEGRRDGAPFDQRDVVSVLMMARQATLKIENDLFYRGIYENMIEVLKSMVNIIESRDPYIRCHSSRVTRYALRIAEGLHLSVQDMDTMRLACLLHDIGKIGIPDSILTKKGDLATDELELIQTHSLIGENIVKPLGFLIREGEIIRTHHECFDGSGYPDGLKGDEIPLSARIIAVADSYDAMTSHRPYRMAKTTGESIVEIERLQGIKYDPQVVQSFRRCLESQP